MPTVYGIRNNLFFSAIALVWFSTFSSPFSNADTSECKEKLGQLGSPPKESTVPPPLFDVVKNRNRLALVDTVIGQISSVGLSPQNENLNPRTFPPEVTRRLAETVKTALDLLIDCRRSGLAPWTISELLGSKFWGSHSIDLINAHLEAQGVCYKFANSRWTFIPDFRSPQGRWARRAMEETGALVVVRIAELLRSDIRAQYDHRYNEIQGSREWLDCLENMEHIFVHELEHSTTQKHAREATSYPYFGRIFADSEPFSFQGIDLADGSFVLEGQHYAKVQHFDEPAAMKRGLEVLAERILKLPPGKEYNSVRDEILWTAGMGHTMALEGNLAIRHALKMEIPMVLLPAENQSAPHTWGRGEHAPQARPLQLLIGGIRMQTLVFSDSTDLAVLQKLGRDQLKSTRAHLLNDQKYFIRIIRRFDPSARLLRKEETNH